MANSADPDQLASSVTQLDARLTGDQEVVGLTPAEVCNIRSWRLIMKYFLWSFSPFSLLLIKEGQILQKPTDLDLHCLQRQGISWFSRTRVNALHKKIICLFQASFR